MSEIIRNSIFTLAIGISAVSLPAQQLPPPPPPVTVRSLPRPQTTPALPAAAQPAQTATNQIVAPTAAQVTNASGPKIQFGSTIYDFGKVKAGDPVKFSYTFTNAGNAVLEVTGVQPQCGCTAAGEWTKKVEPGKTGEIPLQFNTTSYHGQVFKTVTVTCNDPVQSHVLLQLKGNIWKPIDFVPPYTVMNILPDMTSATATVKIVNNMDQPIDIMSPVSGVNGFSAELKTNQPGKEFQLTVTAVPPLNPGTISGKITVQTSSTNTPTLDIPFWANVQAAVMVLPPQVMLSGGPLTTKASPSVTIQNNTTNTLTVSEPAVNLPGVDVQIKELQPGRIFSVQLSFPEGFELQPGQQGVLTIKTSNRQFAELRIPIIQMARPVLATQQAPPIRPRSLPAKIVPQGKTVLPEPPALTK